MKLCDKCKNKKNCKNYESISSQPKLTLVACENYKEGAPDEVQGL